MSPLQRIGLFAGLLLAGCAPAPLGLPDIGAYPSPDDPTIVSSGEGPRSVLGSYTPRSVVEPEGWRSRAVPLQTLPEPEQ
ncbi:hypothetical protein [Jiella marina]|uniref:hypothetical protein n=1 Tax=Jiella sp. LLJ827 TaxID=2917712 RepID=UPI0021009F3D|nr:hypothetical protein [Jiella sp. LLJ827]MCQ0988280.1 hypothetical protein [Jiella sp. LLJ827]